MKLWKRYLIVMGLAVLGAAIIVTAQQRLARRTDQSVDRYTQPLIESELNALVIDKSITDAAERSQSSNAMVYSLKIDYVDIATRNKASFTMNYRYQHRIGVGDTVRKAKGDSYLLVHKKGGGLVDVQVF